jgi:hypothetical protein
MHPCLLHFLLAVGLAGPVAERLAAAEETTTPGRTPRPEVVEIPGERVPDPAAYLAPFIKHLEKKGLPPPMPSWTHSRPTGSWSSESSITDRTTGS